MTWRNFECVIFRILIYIFSICIERRRHQRGAHMATTFGFIVFIRIAHTATTFGFIIFVGEKERSDVHN